jgi:hypothetical protein
MRAPGAFQLDIEPKTDTHPMKVRVVLLGVTPDEHGVIPMTPECMSLDVLEGCLNALQDELDQVRADARQVFMRGILGRA